MKTARVHKVIENLAKTRYPFSLLAGDRLQELADIVRVIEMRKGELFQMRGGRSGDYLFLMQGRVDIILNGGMVSLLSSGDTNTRPFVLPPAPEASTLLAANDSVICHIEREMLDKLISLDEVMHMAEDESNKEMYWRLGMLRNSSVLRRLPFECLEMAFKRMRSIDVAEGQEIIRPGEEVKSCYVLTEGSAEVWHADVYTDELELIEVITEGASFGNDALLTGYESRDLVRMKTSGKLLVLDKNDFDELVRKQLVRTVNAQIAKTMLDNGYRLLDVRYEEEHEESRIPNAILIPLGELSCRANELDPEARYIAYCHSGNRSAVAAMKLAQLNIEALSLEGGIRDWPFGVEGQV